MLDLSTLARPPLTDGAAFSDLEALLDAVKARLRACVEPQQILAGEALVARIRSDVLDCVSALDQLEFTLVRAIRT